MTTKHTPGPWFLFSNGHCVGGPASDGAADLPTAGVAMCGMGRRQQDEIAANARLISAAPDLLIAAKRALNILKAMGETPNPKNALGVLVAAIDKATGATS